MKLSINSVGLLEYQKIVIEPTILLIIIDYGWEENEYIYTVYIIII